MTSPGDPFLANSAADIPVENVKRRANETSHDTHHIISYPITAEQNRAQLSPAQNGTAQHSALERSAAQIRSDQIRSDQIITARRGAAAANQHSRYEHTRTRTHTTGQLGSNQLRSTCLPTHLPTYPPTQGCASFLGC